MVIGAGGGVGNSQPTRNSSPAPEQKCPGKKASAAGGDWFRGFGMAADVRGDFFFERHSSMEGARMEWKKTTSMGFSAELLRTRGRSRLSSRFRNKRIFRKWFRQRGNA